LVGSEESHELWHGFNTDHTGLVDVVMSPGSWEVGLEVLGLGWSIESLVGSENFGSGGFGLGLSHEELTVWGTVLILTFLRVVHDHGFHEKIIGSGGEVLWGNSLVLFVERSGSVFSGLEEISSSLDHLFIGRFGVGLGFLDVLGVSWVGNGNSGGLLNGHGSEEGGNSEEVNDKAGNRNFSGSLEGDSKDAKPSPIV